MIVTEPAGKAWRCAPSRTSSPVSPRSRVARLAVNCAGMCWAITIGAPSGDELRRKSARICGPPVEEATTTRSTLPRGDCGCRGEATGAGAGGAARLARPIAQLLAQLAVDMAQILGGEGRGFRHEIDGAQAQRLDGRLG